MTLRQKLLKVAYPLFRRFASMLGKGEGMRTNSEKVSPNTSFYFLEAPLANGSNLPFAPLRGKKVLLVNVASDCGYTPQYRELERLHQLYKGKLEILAFPANDFKGQEPGTEKDIIEFCKNYSVTFPLFKKDSVTGPDQQNVFHWLSHKDQNGWNAQAPTWNFCKYLVDENGRLEFFFEPYISPLSDMMINAIDGNPAGSTRVAATVL